jgi:hypothetical protein
MTIPMAFNSFLKRERDPTSIVGGHFASGWRILITLLHWINTDLDERKRAQAQRDPNIEELRARQ